MIRYSLCSCYARTVISARDLLRFAPQVLDFFEDFYHFFVDFAIGGEDVGTEEVYWVSICISDGASSFFDDECSSRNIPRFESEFPVSVETSTCDVAKVQGGRSEAADGLRFF